MGCKRRRPHDYSSTEIPEFFWEPGIVGGYREPGISVKESLVSIFELHNETLNIWTHLGALAFFLGYMCSTSSSLNLYSDVTLRPLLFMFLSSCLYSTTSVLAHTFNSMNELSQHVGFMIDYYGICVYAFVTAISNLSYAFPDSWRSTRVEQSFIVASFLSTLLAISLACKSRFPKFGLVCKLMRLLPFVLSYVISMSPLLYRVTMEYDAKDGTVHYYRHFIDAVFTFGFYSSHFPELAFPGYFNVYFHSHQIFHVFVALGTYFKLRGLMADYESGHTFIEIPNCTLLVSLAALTKALVTLYYIWTMRSVKKGKQSSLDHHHGYCNGNGNAHDSMAYNGVKKVN
ncbi:PAQR5 [Bugula neritina]|uniref:PAQR5 n=1 Tax=Bugula neritina TaxID=10212 RepID=A0A7J7K093_BUGNE|nr:PAQR5 [Bugula neritina]